MKRSLVLLLLALSAGCTTLVRPTGPPNRVVWQVRLAHLEKLQNWRLEGRIGVATPNRGGSANVNWRQRGAQWSLTFSGPFGLGAVRLWGNSSVLHMRNSRGREWLTEHPEAALERSLGWPVPVSSLRYWIIGRPAPGASRKIQLGAQGLVRRIEQRGWTVRYEGYGRVGGFLLPDSIIATRPGVRIKLIVSRWRLEPGA